MIDRQTKLSPIREVGNLNSQARLAVRLNSYQYQIESSVLGRIHINAIWSQTQIISLKKNL